jgi:hypothetical protein
MKERNGEWATGRRGDKERKAEENLIHHRADYAPPPPSATSAKDTENTEED